MRSKGDSIFLLLILLAGCQSVSVQDRIETEITLAINRGELAENIDRLVQQTEDPSRTAAVAVCEIMDIESLPDEIEKYWHYYRNTDISSTPSVEIFEIINRYKISVLRVLVPYGVDLNYDYRGDPLVRWEFTWGDPPMTPELLRFLLENGYEPNVGGEHQSPLGFCASPYESFLTYHHKYEMVKDLLKHGANPNAWFWSTPMLHQLITYHRENPHALEIIKLLLEEGANVNVVDENGQTALDRVWWRTNALDDVRSRRIINLLESFGAKRAAELTSNSAVVYVEQPQRI